MDVLTADALEQAGCGPARSLACKALYTPEAAVERPTVVLAERDPAVAAGISSVSS